jgi:hypothetical protein
LHIAKVGHRLIESLGPKVIASFGVDQLRGQADDPATSRRIFPPRCACATASLMEERG